MNKLCDPANYLNSSSLDFFISEKEFGSNTFTVSLFQLKYLNLEREEQTGI